MNNSFEAIYTGVYIFVFIAALTISLYLFNGVNRLAQSAYDFGKISSSSAIIESDGIEDVYLTKEEVISYYFNYVKKDEYLDTYNDEFTFSIQGIANNLTYSQLINALTEENYVLSKTVSGFIIKSI